MRGKMADSTAPPTNVLQGPEFVVRSNDQGATWTDQQPVGDYKYLAAKYPNATKAYGVLTGDLSTTKLVARQTDEIAQSLGWKKVYDDVYPSLGPTSWTPYAESLKSAGVKGLIWVGEPEYLAKLIQAMASRSGSYSHRPTTWPRSARQAVDF